jgi:hypothetical protein
MRQVYCLLEITEITVFFFVTGVLGAIWIWGQFWENLWAVPTESEVHGGISSLADSVPYVMLLCG